MSAWLRQHRQALASALARFRRMSSLLSALVIGVALALPAGGYALLAGLRDVATRIAPEPQVSIFLNRDAAPAQRDAAGAALRADRRVSDVRFVPRDQALKELAEVQGMGAVIEALGTNPLPDAYLVHLKDPALESFVAEAGKLPGVAHVQADTQWATRLAALAAIGRLAVWMLAAVLGAGLVAVTFNTIGLQVLTQREEIEVLQLIGATDAYIHRPFYYLGMLQGLAGGLVALLIVWAGLALLNAEVAELASSYGSGFRFTFLSPGDAAAAAGFAGLIGWLGAYLSVRRRLVEGEPTASARY
jgi:cell division transport system permease protein